MFMKRIRQLAIEWGKAPHEMECVARESLLYGMRLVTRPTRLKSELKKIGIDSKLATPLWSGNFYLLQILPTVLLDKKKKIPSLEDFQFARKVLKKFDLKLLEARVKNLSGLCRDEMLAKLLKTATLQQSYRGRFLPKFDRMHEHKHDIQHDLACETLAIINKEWTNFKTNDPNEIQGYLSYCLKNKANTYLENRAPKLHRAEMEDDEALDRAAHQRQSLDCNLDLDHSTVILRTDLQKILSPQAYRGISLLLNFARKPDEHEFLQFLQAKGLKRDGLSYSKLKVHIERHLGVKVFQEMKTTPQLVEYLRG